MVFISQPWHFFSSPLFLIQHFTTTTSNNTCLILLVNKSCLPMATSAAQRPSRSFRISSKNLFLTYPQCSVSKDAVLTHLLATLDRWDPQVMIVAQEHHAEEGLHLHCFVQLKKKCTIRNPLRLDLPADLSDDLTEPIHGNYQAARVISRVVLYCTKEDEAPATFGIPDLQMYLKAIKNRESSKLARVAASILDGTFPDMASIIAEEPSLLISHKRKLEDAFAWVKETNRLALTLPYHPPPLPQAPTPIGQIADWVACNLHHQRPFKKDQLWIQAPPDHGKTSFINYLAKMVKTYFVPVDDQWDDLYCDDYDLVVIDEFRGQRRITWLNGFVQGGTFPVRRRGVAPYIKMKNIPVIVLSNYSPQDAYPRCSNVAWQSIIARFQVVVADEPLFPLIESLTKPAR